MKLTLDSKDPLEDALRVVGALYGVTLTVADEAAQSREVTEPAEVASGQAIDGEPTELEAPVEPERPKRTTSSRRASKGSRRSGPVTDTPGVAASGRDSNRNGKASNNAEIRAWARENGITVSGRGKLPASVVTAYRDAHEQ